MEQSRHSELFMQTVYESLAGSTSIEEERREIQDTLPLLWVYAILRYILVKSSNRTLFYSL